MSIKFEFDSEFQLGILSFILKDPNGDKALELVNQQYFDLITHAVILEGIQVFYRRFQKIPDKVFLKDQLRVQYQTRDLQDLTDAQKDQISSLIDVLFEKVVKHGDILLESVAKFASFVKMKETLETLELKNFESYAPFAARVSQALEVATIEKEEDKPEPLLQGVQERIVRRISQESVIPTPFHEINKLTNAGGYSKGSIIVVLDKPKNLKTAFLINWAKGCLRLRRNALYIDMENGRDELLTRFDQSISGSTKKEIITGAADDKLLAMAKRYKRLGGELIVRRLPSKSSTRDIQREIDEAYREHGIIITDLFIDYIGLMDSLSKRSEDKDRISDAYLDVANLALHNNIYHVVTAHHITRDGERRETTKYKDIDIAKCIEIVRHAQVIMGLNRTHEERAADVLRAEVVAQRDGVPDGRGLFITDIPKQSIKPMSPIQAEQYQAAIGAQENTRENESGGDI